MYRGVSGAARAPHSPAGDVVRPQPPACPPKAGARGPGPTAPAGSAAYPQAPPAKTETGGAGSERPAWAILCGLRRLGHPAAAVWPGRALPADLWICVFRWLISLEEARELRFRLEDGAHPALARWLERSYFGGSAWPPPFANCTDGCPYLRLPPTEETWLLNTSMGRRGAIRMSFLSSATHVRFSLEFPVGPTGMTLHGVRLAGLYRVTVDGGTGPRDWVSRVADRTLPSLAGERPLGKAHRAGAVRASLAEAGGAELAHLVAREARVEVPARGLAGRHKERVAQGELVDEAAAVHPGEGRRRQERRLRVAPD